MSFAPPPNLSTPSVTPDIHTGDDAYTQRMGSSEIFNGDPSPGIAAVSPPPPAPPPTSVPVSIKQPPPPLPQHDQALPPTISRAPVRYNLPPPPSDIPKSEAELETALEEEAIIQDEEPASVEAPRSLRPGQRGFAERLMSKYGWTKGSGLGASGSGIVNPLRVQVEKQKKKPDSEGGGFVGPGGRGKIIGGKKNKDMEAEGGKFGAMSEVVVLKGMVDGMDLDAEMEAAGDGGIMQEIGEECGEKVNSNVLLLLT